MSEEENHRNEVSFSKKIKATFQKWLPAAATDMVQSRTPSSSSSSSPRIIKEVEPDQNLFQLIHFRPWDREERTQFDEAAVLQYISQHPQSVLALYDFKTGTGRGATKNYCLHRIIALGASLALIQKVHTIHPIAMTYRTPDFGSTSLHAACMYAASLDVLEYILQQDKDKNGNDNMIRQTTKHVFLPLHLACQADIPHAMPLAQIQLLVEAYPAGLLRKNKLGDTPWKTAQRNKSSRPEVLDYLERKTAQLQLQQQPQEYGGEEEGNQQQEDVSTTLTTATTSSEFLFS